MTAEVKGILSFRLMIDGSKDTGYCSSLRIDVSSTD
jgi:hypothetical protein